MKKLVYVFLVCFALFRIGEIYGNGWDVEYWQYLNLKNWECGPYKLYTIGETRLNHNISTFYYFKIAENFAYQALPFLDLEAHYCFIYNKSRGSSQFKHANRLEFEINPFVTFEDWVTLKWRNRIELQKKQGVSHIQFIARHRTLASFAIKKSCYLTSIQIYDEIFYDFDTNRISQNRFVPCELSFKADCDITVDLFVMIRNFYSFSSKKWYKSFAIGSEIGF